MAYNTKTATPTIIWN